MVSLRQKINMLKTCEKRLYKHITFVLCKKRLEKIANNNLIGKNEPYAKAFAKWPVWVKHWNCQKHMENDCTSVLELFYTNDGSKKQLILEKLDDLENWKNGHYGKAIAFAK